jgi:hypothetical protein
VRCRSLNHSQRPDGDFMKIRFVEGFHSLISWDIEARENLAIPLTPSHVEAVSQDGTSYIGAHLDGGIQARPLDYDKGTFAHDLIIDLGTDNDIAAFDYINSKIGTPYDWTSIADFVLPVNWHAQNHLICSAFMALALRRKLFFPFVLAAPAHMISPRDLLLMMSTRMHVPGL